MNREKMLRKLEELCIEMEDPITMEEFKDLDRERLMGIRPFGKEVGSTRKFRCYTKESLDKLKGAQKREGNTYITPRKDPFTREVYDQMRMKRKNDNKELYEDFGSSYDAMTIDPSIANVLNDMEKINRTITRESEDDVIFETFRKFLPKLIRLLKSNKDVDINAIFTLLLKYSDQVEEFVDLERYCDLLWKMFFKKWDQEKRCPFSIMDLRKLIRNFHFYGDFQESFDMNNGEMKDLVEDLRKDDFTPFWTRIGHIVRKLSKEDQEKLLRLFKYGERDWMFIVMKWDVRYGVTGWKIRGTF